MPQKGTTPGRLVVQAGTTTLHCTVPNPEYQDVYPDQRRSKAGGECRVFYPQWATGSWAYETVSLPGGQ